MGSTLISVLGLLVIIAVSFRDRCGISEIFERRRRPLCTGFRAPGRTFYSRCHCISGGHTAGPGLQTSPWDYGRDERTGQCIQITLHVMPPCGGMNLTPLKSAPTQLKNHKICINIPNLHSIYLYNIILGHLGTFQFF